LDCFASAKRHILSHLHLDLDTTKLANCRFDIH
jgi:hypothetical protein